MLLAIRQALAGPHKSGENWLDKPVARKVDQIYRGHLNMRNRQVAREQGRLTEYDDGRLYSQVDAGEDRFGAHDEPDQSDYEDFED